ncbi:MAG TPA: MFS transporter [Candidatus Acidoferrales bacterium]|nr:MFS transporter [Candidatus Acidoferrales bacterium]
MPMIPTNVAAIISALQFQGGQRQALGRLTDSQWQDLFCCWEIARLLIPLRQRYGSELPEWVRSRIDRNLADNRERFERIRRAYADFAEASQARGGEHLVIKGFAQWPDFVEHPRFRLQSDIDVYCPPTSMPQVLDALHDLGYEPSQTGSVDHLPAMVSKAPWTWRGNAYDPDIPVSFELHFCFWNESFTRVRLKGPDQFWLRRVEQRLDDLSFPALAPVDKVAYSALNILRETLYAAMPPHLVYELARFLDLNAGNDQFWKTWQELHDDSLRRLEAVSFRLADHYFGCRLPDEVRQEMDRQPPAVRRWFQEFAHSPLSAAFRPNKDALWLHMGVLSSARDRRAILLEGLFPIQLPPMEAPHIQNTEKRRRAVPKRLRYVSYMAGRAAYHARILPATIWHGFRWWRSTTALGKDFLTFLAVLFLFNFGMYVFFLLYNLYLLDRGFRENFLGTVVGAMTLGGVLGTLPAGVLVQRVGLRKALLICLILVSVLSALRSMLVSPLPCLALAFLTGFASVIWAVALSPTIAELTTENSRAVGFTAVFFFGIAVGVLGGQAGGRLPGWLMQLSPLLTASRAKEAALLLACGIIALATVPAFRLGLTSKPIRQQETYSWSPFLARFLVTMAVWSLAIGGFSPFSGAYFSRFWQMPVHEIGTIDSTSRVSQLLAILAAPVLFRKFGLVTGMVYAQIATAIALACLASAFGPSAAAATYVGYVAFQWMSEPAIFTLLMNHLKPKDRAGASALTFLVMNASQAIATVVAGVCLVRFGYPSVIAVTAVVALAAALSFWLLADRETGDSQASLRAVDGATLGE